MKQDNSPTSTTNAAFKVRILYADSGRGLSVDAELLRFVLQRVGCQVELTTCAPWSVRRTLASHRVAGIKRRLPQGWVGWLERQQVQLQARGKPPVELQIHLESPIVEYLGAAQINWLIPNQEWLRPQHLGYFSMLDQLLVKTDEAARRLETHHPSILLLGFSNLVAERLPAITEDKTRFRRFLHVAGRNRKKGTGAIIDAWRRHPEWPQLQLVIDDISPFMPLPANIRHWNRPDGSQLDQLHRDCGIVLAPSEVEGYGHILVESMAYQSVVLTTDAAPMNELVTDQRGYLVDWHSQQPCHFGTRYFIQADAIEAAVSRVLSASDDILLAKSLAARHWVQLNHRTFIDRFKQQIALVRSSRLSVVAAPDEPRPVISGPGNRGAHHA